MLDDAYEERERNKIFRKNALIKSSFFKKTFVTFSNSLTMGYLCTLAG